jgi:hypothetical protein
LTPHPVAKIIVSTSWVRARSFSYAERRLNPQLQKRVIGATFHQRLMRLHEFVALARGMQIWGDVQRRKPLDRFAIDDDCFGWSTWCRDKLVLTQERLGLSYPAVQDGILRCLEEWQ